jgi:lysophospholipase L1-like esterase
MNWETYAAFGDSITIGARSYIGYPEYLVQLLERHTNKTWNLINHSSSGYKAIDLARSIDKDFCNLKAHNPSFCTVLIGTNDVKEHTSADDFQIAYRLVVTKLMLMMLRPDIKLLGIPLFPKGVMYPYNITMNESIPTYNAIIQTIAAEHGIEFCQISIDADDLFDGVHLNQKGCKSVASYISELVLKERGL